MSSPKLQKISCHVVGVLELVHQVIVEAYVLTVHCKRDTYRCWLACKVALRSLIE